MNGRCCDKCGAPIQGGDASGGDELAELLGGGQGGEGGGDVETELLEQLLDKLGGKSVERFKKPDIEIDMIAAGKPKKDDEDDLLG